MNVLYQQKEQANLHRKNGRYEEALPLYQVLWENSQDKFDGAGLLHCLRKLKRYDEAIPLAKELEKQHLDFNWSRIEITWTYIGGILNKITEKDSLGKTLTIANHILKLNPDNLAVEKVVFTVLKKAKQFKKWDMACEWVDKLNPETIDATPITTDRGNTGWNYVSIWYLHKIRCLIHQGQFLEAIEKVEFVLQKPTQHEKYYRRLEAMAYQKLGKIEEAERILSTLSQARKADWWILHDYANLLKKKGDKEQALQMMYKASALARKIEGILSLLYDAASLAKDLNRKEESYYHFQLWKLIRERNGWKVTDIDGILLEMSKDNELPSTVSYHEALKKCKGYWGDNVSTEKHPKRVNKSIRKSLIGNVINVKEGVPFCFINTGTESFFCFVKDIPGVVAKGLSVQFDAIPSFDKKKNKESWKAINITLR